MTDIKVIALFYELFSMFVSLVFVCCLIITLFVLAVFAVKRILKKRSQGYNENLRKANTILPSEIINIRAAAIKEFAERLKEKSNEIVLGGKYKYQVVTTEGVDNLVKEMTGDAE